MERIIKSIEERYLLSECLMVKELIPGALSGIRGRVSYQHYECLR